jgi:hypothetical protein
MLMRTGADIFRLLPAISSSAIDAHCFNQFNEPLVESVSMRILRYLRRGRQPKETIRMQSHATPGLEGMRPM